MLPGRYERIFHRTRTTGTASFPFASRFWFWCVSDAFECTEHNSSGSIRNVFEKIPVTFSISLVFLFYTITIYIKLKSHQSYHDWTAISCIKVRKQDINHFCTCFGCRVMAVHKIIIQRFRSLQ